MTIFKTFLKVLNKCKGTVILYSIILISFGSINMTTNNSAMDFSEEKPNILIVNKDESKGITKSLINYLTSKSNIKDIYDSEEARDDAVFYREVAYIIYIPKNFNDDFMSGKNPTIDIKSPGDYNSSLTELLLKKYIKVAGVYAKNGYSEDEVIKKTESTLSSNLEIEMTTKLDTYNLARTTRYYNFLSYSMLAGCIYVICLILYSFKIEIINKRTIISSTNYKRYNRILFTSNILFAVLLCFIYVLISYFMIGDIIFSKLGLLYIINSFIFTICAVSIAFLISNLVKDRNAINGIINVVALGSSFLCGAFVPIEWLPKSVLTIAHVLPSYYFIKSNEIIKELEVINLTNLKPIIINMVILLLFTIVFIIISNIVTKKKRQFN